MTKQEIDSGNILIAEFMGYKLITPDMRRKPETWGHSYWQKNYPNEQDVLCEEKWLCYHSDWNWIMKAVKKIYDQRGWASSDHDIKTFLLAVDIKRVFNEVIKEIKTLQEA